MRALVTGAAGFIGSHLCTWLLDNGDAVAGIDALTPYYDRRVKEANLASIGERAGFTFVETDLIRTPLDRLLDDVDVVYHLAGQPGVRASWDDDFGLYVRNNIDATQRLLDAVRMRPIGKFVYASSSSVYGDAETFPTPESATPRPVSPYGVTKLAAEHLCEVYRTGFGVPVASLRLFTVYGPRQRPDMAFSRLVAAAVRGSPFVLYGDGEQSRDFTFVGDVVRAMRDAATAPWCGVANIGGGARTTMNRVIEIVGDLSAPISVSRTAAQRGDARHTAADTACAANAFGYAPSTRLEDGLAEMVAWMRAGAERVPA